jgi:hypothetical protein
MHFVRLSSLELLTNSQHETRHSSRLLCHQTHPNQKRRHPQSRERQSHFKEEGEPESHIFRDVQLLANYSKSGMTLR